MIADQKQHTMVPIYGHTASTTRCATKPHLIVILIFLAPCLHAETNFLTFTIDSGNVLKRVVTTSINSEAMQESTRVVDGWRWGNA